MSYRISLFAQGTGQLIATKDVETMQAVGEFILKLDANDHVRFEVKERVKCPGSKRMTTILGGGYVYCPTCGRQTWADGLWPAEHYPDDPKLEQDVRVKECQCSGVNHAGRRGWIQGFRSMLAQRYYVVSLNGNTLNDLHCWATAVQPVEERQASFEQYADEGFQMAIEEADALEASRSTALSSAALTGHMTG